MLENKQQPGQACTVACFEGQVTTGPAASGQAPLQQTLTVADIRTASNSRRLAVTGDAFGYWLRDGCQALHPA